MPRPLQRPNLSRNGALIGQLSTKLDALPFLQGLVAARRYIAEVCEQVLGSIVRFDESEALRGIEPTSRCLYSRLFLLLLLLLAGRILVKQVDFRADHLLGGRSRASDVVQIAPLMLAITITLWSEELSSVRDIEVRLLRT